MTDSETPASAPTGEPQPPAVQIHAQYLKDLSFESPNATALMALRQPPQVQVQVDVRANPVEGTEHTEVVLHLRCDATVQDKQAFIIEADYAALVSISADLPRERRAAALMIEVPNMLFPFARQIQALRDRMGNQADGAIDPTAGTA